MNNSLQAFQLVKHINISHFTQTQESQNVQINQMRKVKNTSYLKHWKMIRKRTKEKNQRKKKLRKKLLSMKTTSMKFNKTMFKDKQKRNCLLDLLTTKLIL